MTKLNNQFNVSTSGTEFEILEIIELFIKKIVNVSLYANVISYDIKTNLVSVQPAINKTSLDNNGNIEYTPYGIIYNIPYYSEGNSECVTFTKPIQGDVGLIIVNNSDIQNFLKSYKQCNPASTNQFTLSNSQFFLNASPNKVPANYRGGKGTFIGDPRGVNYININSNGITLNGNVMLVNSDGTSYNLGNHSHLAGALVSPSGNVTGITGSPVVTL